MVKIHFSTPSLLKQVASYPGFWWVERERAWYLLFTHARKYPLLNTCSGKSGRGTRILIHVIDSVTYNLANILVQ